MTRARAAAASASAATLSPNTTALARVTKSSTASKASAPSKATTATAKKPVAANKAAPAKAAPAKKAAPATKAAPVKKPAAAKKPTAKAAAKTAPSTSSATTPAAPSTSAAASTSTATSTAATRATTTKKRKLRTFDDDNDIDDDDEDDLSKEDNTNTRRTMIRPAKKLRGPAKKAVDPETDSESELESGTQHPKPKGKDAESTVAAPVTKPTRGRPKRSATTIATASTAENQTSSTISRTRKRKAATQDVVVAAAKKPAKKTRSRKATGTVTTDYTTEPTPGLKSAVSRPASKLSGVLKKTVTFEEPGKENAVANPATEAKTETTGAPATGMRAKPVRKYATSGRTTRASARAATAEPTEKKPLSPRKDGQNRPLSRDSRDSGSDDELATYEKTPLKPLMKSPIKPPSGVKKLELLPLEKEKDDNSPQSAEPTLASVLSSPARRPPPSPFKDAMKSPAKRVDTVPCLLFPSTSGEPQDAQSLTKSTMLQSPAKRPTLPLQVFHFTPEQSSATRSPTKMSMLNTPAKRPGSPMKLFGPSVQQTEDKPQEARDEQTGTTMEQVIDEQTPTAVEQIADEETPTAIEQDAEEQMIMAVDSIPDEQTPPAIEQDSDEDEDTISAINQTLDEQTTIAVEQNADEQTTTTIEQDTDEEEVTVIAIDQTPNEQTDNAIDQDADEQTPAAIEQDTDEEEVIVITIDQTPDGQLSTAIEQDADEQMITAMEQAIDEQLQSQIRADTGAISPPECLMVATKLETIQEAEHEDSTYLESPTPQPAFPSHFSPALPRLDYPLPFPEVAIYAPLLDNTKAQQSEAVTTSASRKDELDVEAALDDGMDIYEATVEQHSLYVAKSEEHIDSAEHKDLSGLKPNEQSTSSTDKCEANAEKQTLSSPTQNTSQAQDMQDEVLSDSEDELTLSNKAITKYQDSSSTSDAASATPAAPLSERPRLKLPEKARRAVARAINTARNGSAGNFSPLPGWTPYRHRRARQKKADPPSDDDEDEYSLLEDNPFDALQPRAPRSFFDEEMKIRADMDTQAEMEALIEADIAAKYDKYDFNDLGFEDEDASLAGDDDGMSLFNAQGSVQSELPDSSSLDGSQVHSNEYSVPIDPALIGNKADDEASSGALANNGLASGAPVTPKRTFASREVHTVSQIPLKRADDSPPRSVKRRRSTVSTSPPRRIPYSNVSVPGNRFLQATVESESDEESDLSPAPAPRSSLGTPARITRPDLNPDLLRGAIVFVDVHTAEGIDAGRIFVDILVRMGARCVKSWPWNPTSLSGGEPDISRVGITHVVYKDGGKRTLEKVIESKGAVHCVGVSWILE